MGRIDLSICPTLICPLSTYDSNSYKVRTLLDSGSSTNWIASEILPHIKYEIIGSKVLTVNTFSGRIRKRFELIEAYFQYKLPPIRCFVMDTFSEAQIIRGLDRKIKKHIKTNNIKSKMLHKWVNPAELPANHDDINKGCGLILASTAINSIMNKNEKQVVLDKLDLVFDSTYFGLIVSGRVPDDLVGNITTHKATVTPQIVGEKTIFANTTQNRVEEVFFQEQHKLRHSLEIMWDKETLGVYQHELHNNDKAALESFKSTVKKDPLSGQYEVGLPFNERKKDLKDNFYQAKARAVKEQEKMLSDKEYATLFRDNFNTLLENRYVERVNMNEKVEGPIVYLPYRGILKRDSKTTKLRIVMDASAKPSRNDFSLNQCLYQGPNKVVDLAQCLIRFMLGKYGCIADIEKVFLRIWIRKQDRDVQRFLVPSNPADPNSELICYRYTSVMFGSICSPFLLAAVLEKHILDTCKDEEVKLGLTSSTYIDNISYASENENKVINFFETSKGTLMEGGFKLCQWASNSIELMNRANKLNIADNSESVKVLGMHWLVKNDKFTFKQDLKWDGLYTKRSVLATTNAIFDPLSYLCPIEIQNRFILQNLWDKNMGWDESFEGNADMVGKWNSQLRACEEAVKIDFDRHTIITPQSEIHAFCDASAKAYGTTVYIRTPPCKEYPSGSVKLLVAKGKIKPLKSANNDDTIPKLELTAMLLGANLVNFVKNALNLSREIKTYLWSDARVVLDWCSSTNIDSTYIHRRVVDIRNKCPTAIIRHVPTSDNPADIITRPISLKNFKKCQKWWNGPNWLNESESHWPKDAHTYDLNPSVKINVMGAMIKLDCRKNEYQIESLFRNFQNKDLHIAPELVMNMKKNINSEIGDTLLDFFKPGNFKKGITILSYILRFVKRCRKKAIERKSSGEPYLKVSSEELKKCSEESLRILSLERKLRKDGKTFPNRKAFESAKLTAVKIMQNESFPYEIKLLNEGKQITKGPCRDLGLFRDDKAIIRCKGRLHHLIDPYGSNEPILVSPRHPFTKSYIHNKHFHTNCASKNYTLNKVRREIHGPSIKHVVSNIVRNCHHCRIARAQNLRFKYPKSPQLPNFRTEYVAPFAATGVDLAGPFSVKSENRHKKVWIILFTCLVTRAVYLILVDNISAVTFLYALKELSARHSSPIQLVSDNATNFTCTNKILMKIKDETSQKIDCKLKWDFIPVKAPWFGGIYERLIQIMKKELIKMTRGTILTYEEFKDHVIEVESIINDRPLQAVGDDEIITPAKLIYGNKIFRDSNLSSLAIEELLENAEKCKQNLPSLYTENLRRKKEFWLSFQEQYLEMLRFKPGIRESTNSGKTPKVGDLVMIYEKDPRIKPKKGLILHCIKSQDGEIRKCKVRIGKHESVRPVSSLHDLELNVYEDSEISVRQNNGNHNCYETTHKKLLDRNKSAVCEFRKWPEILITAEKPQENPIVLNKNNSDRVAKKNAKLEIKKLANEDRNLVRYYKGLQAIE